MFWQNEAKMVMILILNMCFFYQFKTEQPLFSFILLLKTWIKYCTVWCGVTDWMYLKVFVKIMHALVLSISNREFGQKSSDMVAVLLGSKMGVASDQNTRARFSTFCVINNYFGHTLKLAWLTCRSLKTWCKKYMIYTINTNLITLFSKTHGHGIQIVSCRSW